MIVTSKGGEGGIELEDGGGVNGGGEDRRGIRNENVGMVRITFPLGTCEEVGVIGVCFVPLGF
jgi:hypothetical protein